MNEFKKAEAAYLEAIDIDPHDSHARHWYGQMLAADANGKYQAALEQFMEVSNIKKNNPFYVESLPRIARCYGKLGDIGDAEKLHLRVIDMDPNNPNLYYEYGLFLNDHFQDKSQLALVQFQKSFNLSETARCAYEMAPIYEELRYYDKADVLSNRNYIRKDHGIQVSLWQIFETCKIECC